MSEIAQSVASTLKLPRGALKRLAPPALTFLAMVGIMVAVGVNSPNVWSNLGLLYTFGPIVPLVIAALAQMVMMSIGDIDLGIGAYIGMITAISATWLFERPLAGVLALVAAVLLYAALGALVELRKVPALIATLGAYFVFLGIGLLFRPTPGGTPPAWIVEYASWRPFIPMPLITMVVITAAVWFIMQRTRLGVELRMLGSNPAALRRSGAHPVWVRMKAYILVGVLGVLAGFALVSQTFTGDPNSVTGYALVTIAAVILGGGSFFGGRAVAWGTLFGAVTLGLLVVLLVALKLGSNIQPAIQGGIIILALAGRLVIAKIVKE